MENLENENLENPNQGANANEEFDATGKVEGVQPKSQEVARSNRAVVRYSQAAESETDDIKGGDIAIEGSYNPYDSESGRSASVNDIFDDLRVNDVVEIIDPQKDEVKASDDMESMQPFTYGDDNRSVKEQLLGDDIKYGIDSPTAKSKGLSFYKGHALHLTSPDRIASDSTQSPYDKAAKIGDRHVFFNYFDPTTKKVDQDAQVLIRGGHKYLVLAMRNPMTKTDTYMEGGKSTGKYIYADVEDFRYDGTAAIGQLHPIMRSHNKLFEVVDITADFTTITQATHNMLRVAKMVGSSSYFNKIQRVYEKLQAITDAEHLEIAKKPGAKPLAFSSSLANNSLFETRFGENQATGRPMSCKNSLRNLIELAADVVDGEIMPVLGIAQLKDVKGRISGCTKLEGRMRNRRFTNLMYNTNARDNATWSAGYGLAPIVGTIGASPAKYANLSNIMTRFADLWKEIQAIADQNSKDSGSYSAELLFGFADANQVEVALENLKSYLSMPSAEAPDSADVSLGRALGIVLPYDPNDFIQWTCDGDAIKMQPTCCFHIAPTDQTGVIVKSQAKTYTYVPLWLRKIMIAFCDPDFRAKYFHGNKVREEQAYISSGYKKNVGKGAIEQYDPVLELYFDADSISYGMVQIAAACAWNHAQYEDVYRNNDGYINISLQLEELGMLEGKLRFHEVLDKFVKAVEDNAISAKRVHAKDYPYDASAWNARYRERQFNQIGFVKGAKFEEYKKSSNKRLKSEFAGITTKTGMIVLEPKACDAVVENFKRFEPVYSFDDSNDVGFNVRNVAEFWKWLAATQKSQGAKVCFSDAADNKLYNPTGAELSLLVFENDGITPVLFRRTLPDVTRREDCTYAYRKITDDGFGDAVGYTTDLTSLLYRKDNQIDGGIADYYVPVLVNPRLMRNIGHDMQVSDEGVMLTYNESGAEHSIFDRSYGAIDAMRIMMCPVVFIDAELNKVGPATLPANSVLADGSAVGHDGRAIIPLTIKDHTEEPVMIHVTASKKDDLLKLKAGAKLDLQKLLGAAIVYKKTVGNGYEVKTADKDDFEKYLSKATAGMEEEDVANPGSTEKANFYRYYYEPAAELGDTFVKTALTPSMYGTYRLVPENVWPILHSGYDMYHYDREVRNEVKHTTMRYGFLRDVDAVTTTEQEKIPTFGAKLATFCSVTAAGNLSVNSAPYLDSLFIVMSEQTKLVDAAYSKTVLFDDLSKVDLDVIKDKIDDAYIIDENRLAEPERVLFHYILMADSRATVYGTIQTGGETLNPNLSDIGKARLKRKQKLQEVSIMDLSFITGKPLSVRDVYIYDAVAYQGKLASNEHAHIDRNDRKVATVVVGYCVTEDDYRYASEYVGRYKPQVAYPFPLSVVQVARKDPAIVWTGDHEAFINSKITKSDAYGRVLRENVYGALKQLRLESRDVRHVDSAFRSFFLHGKDVEE